MRYFDKSRCLYFSLICSDVMKSIPDLSKITILHFTNLSSQSTYPSATFTRRLLNKMPKIDTLRLSYDYLQHLLRSPLIVRILTKEIRSLSIRFSSHCLVPEDIIRIGNVFATNLRFLYFDILDINCLPADICLILSLLISEKWKKFYTFHFRLSKQQAQLSQSFPEIFKQSVNYYLNAQNERRKTNSNIMEYKITDNELSILF